MHNHTTTEEADSQSGQDCYCATGGVTQQFVTSPGAETPTTRQRRGVGNPPLASQDKLLKSWNKWHGEWKRFDPASVSKQLVRQFIRDYIQNKPNIYIVRDGDLFHINKCGLPVFEGRSLQSILLSAHQVNCPVWFFFDTKDGIYKKIVSS